MRHYSLVFSCLLLFLGTSSCLGRRPGFDDTFTATTPPGLPSLPVGPALRVLVFGDYGTGDEGQSEVARSIAETHADAPPHFVLTVGDNFYPSGVGSVDDPQWKQTFETVYSGDFWDDLVFFPTLGNHDYTGYERAQIQYSTENPRWSMPDNYYTFRRELPSGDTVRFLALDTNVLEDRDDRAQLHLEWIDSILGTSTDQWIVAYGHHPMVSGSWHGASQTVRSQLEHRFQGRVPLFLSGHNHAIELAQLSDDLLQAVCGGGGGQDNPYAVDRVRGTVSAFTNGGWCFLHFWSEIMAIELYNRAGTLRFRYLILPWEESEG